MAKTAVDDYSATAASNTDIDGLDATGATGLVKSGDNYTRSMMAHLKGKMNDLGAVNTVAGTADAITVTLSSAPTALVDGMRFTFSATAANTGATTLNVTPAGGAALGAKKLMKWAAGVESALAAGDIAGAGSLVEVIYDSAADAAEGAFILAHPATAITFATNAQAVTGTSTVLSVNPANLAFVTDGYATTATAAGTTTLTVTSEPQQFFTGTTTQIVALPVTSTLNLGRRFRIVNNSTGAVTVNSSGGNLVATVGAGQTSVVTCILTSGTSAASWSAVTSSASSAGLVLLTSGTVSAAASLDIPLTAYTAYRGILVKLTNFVPATDAANLWARVSTNGGSSYDAGAGAYKWTGYEAKSNGGSSPYASNSDTKIIIGGSGTGSGAAEGISAEATIMGQTSTALKPKVSVKAGYYITDDSLGAYYGDGLRDTAQDTDAVQFLFSSGNITSGSYAVYGYV